MAFTHAGVLPTVQHLERALGRSQRLRRTFRDHWLWVYATVTSSVLWLRETEQLGRPGLLRSGQRRRPRAIGIGGGRGEAEPTGGTEYDEAEVQRLVFGRGAARRARRALPRGEHRPAGSDDPL